MNNLYEHYKEQAEFFLVYIKEAHPEDGWAMPVKGKYYKDPTTFGERQAIAETCTKDLDIRIPTLIDELDDGVADAYDAMPDRLYIVGEDGTVAFRGERGPFGFKPEVMETRLRELLELPADGRVLSLEDSETRDRGRNRRKGSRRRPGANL